MTSLADARVLFVAATGHRRGLSQLVQNLLLARARGVRPLVAMPGQPHDANTALALGADVVPAATPRVIETMRPDVVVVDDVIAAQTGSWIIAGQRAGAVILDINELGFDTDEMIGAQCLSLLPAAEEQAAVHAAR